MKGVKYLMAAALLLCLQAEAKRAKLVDVEEAPTIAMSEMKPCTPGCECASPTIELVDECVSVRKHSPDMCFKTKSDWECIRTYKINGEDECVKTLNGEPVTSCDPCCKPVCRPCRPCRPRCRPRCRPCCD